MEQCKWEKDDFKQTASEPVNAAGRLCKACVNADCEHCDNQSRFCETKSPKIVLADFCDHYENPQECECYEAENKTITKPNTTDAVFIYWQ